jgi:hypothetical protein
MMEALIGHWRVAFYDRNLTLQTTTGMAMLQQCWMLLAQGEKKLTKTRPSNCARHPCRRCDPLPHSTVRGYVRNRYLETE